MSSPDVSKTYTVKRSNGETGHLAVPDFVTESVVAYASYLDVQLVCIVQACINQQNHLEKQRGLDAMDLVYRYSQLPVGILAMKIAHQRQLEPLTELLSGDWSVLETELMPDWSDDVLKETIGKMLDVIKLVQSKPWGQRTSIFQEEYLRIRQDAVLNPTQRSS